MHHVTIWAILASAAFLVGCVDPIGPIPRNPRPTGAVRFPRPPVSLPDSVGIFPLPVPPIYEELPEVDVAPQ